MEERIEYILSRAMDKKPLSLETIYKKYELMYNDRVSLTDEEKDIIKNVLEEGCKKSIFFKTEFGKYILPIYSNFIVGIFHENRDGSGYIVSNGRYRDLDGKLLIKERRVNISNKGNSDNGNNIAIDGDIVYAYCPEKGENKVLKVLERKLNYVTGYIKRIGNEYHLIPTDKKKSNLTFILPGNQIEGQIVAISAEKTTDNKTYIGKIVETFGHRDDPGNDITWIALQKGVPISFNGRSKSLLKSIPNYVRDIDKIGREDLTQEEIFTIDGIDTKDMDDGVGIKINSKGNFVLNVSIVDIASIVPEGSSIDKDAFLKGNSYYLGNKVFPMFSHEISNGIGSLNPYEERMTISIIMEYTPNGQLVNYRLAPTVIKSKMKMNYDKVNDILKNGKVDSEYVSYVNSLNNMGKLARVLRKNRIKSGAFVFNKPEPRLKYDKDGNVIGFIPRVQDEAENLIEEFMIAANEVVDKELSGRGIPFPHRFHDRPNEKKIGELLDLLRVLNIPYEKYTPKEIVDYRIAFEDLLDHIGNSVDMNDNIGLYNLLISKALGCMSRAKYSMDETGHYGLNKDYYCHFTSPVRRYADLTVQRILWDCVFRQNDVPKRIDKWRSLLPDICEQASKMERVADECEAEVYKMQVAGYMEDKIGSEYVGTITDVNKNGFYVELDDIMVEGFVSHNNLAEDYNFLPKDFSYVSSFSGPNYCIGDRVRVSIKNASKAKHLLEFDVVEKISSSKNTNDKKKKIKSKRKKS